MKAERRFLNGLLRPQGLLGLLVFACGLLVFLSVSGRVRVTPPEHVMLQEPAAPELEQQEVQLVLVDASGRQETVRRRIGLPREEGARLRAVLGELRQVLGEEGVWPKGLNTPTVFVVERFGRERMVVLDFVVGDGLAATVEQEFQTLESIRRTLLASGMDAVEVLVNDQAAQTFLGHVALEPNFE